LSSNDKYVSPFDKRGPDFPHIVQTNRDAARKRGREYGNPARQAETPDCAPCTKSQGILLARHDAENTIDADLTDAQGGNLAGAMREAACSSSFDLFNGQAGQGKRVNGS
jgi:hypothetical protein